MFCFCHLELRRDAVGESDREYFRVTRLIIGLSTGSFASHAFVVLA